MGASSVVRSRTYLEKTEIEKICSKNKYINAVFPKVKNEDGFLTIKELNAITNGLLRQKILKKIFQICGSKKDKLTYDDFCYFYALLNTSSFEAKLNFLLDFIFMKNNKLSKEKYINKINKYYNNSKLLTNIFLDENLIQNISNFNRDNIYSYIEKNFKKILESYPLYQSKTNINMNYNSNINNTNDNDEINNNNNNHNNNNIEINDNNENTLILMNNSSKEHSKTSINSVNIAIKKQNYDSLEEEFKNIEKRNNGLFPICLFEDMLREINIDDGLVEIIGDYLKKKTKKSFFNFDLFKEVLSLLISEENYQKKINKELGKGIFILASYPKNFIDKKSLLILFKKDKNIQRKLEKLENDKHLDLNQFLDLYNYNNDIFNESLEHIQYLKYIFFKEKIGDNHSIENKCIRILLKNKSMHDYILERIQYDNSFYLIDIEFWNKWNELSLEDSDINNNKLRKLRINTKNFSDNQGKILEGCIFPDDYVIVSKTIYNLFNQWYGPPLGLEIIRYKIYLDDETNNINSQKKKRKKDESSIFYGTEKKTNKKFELEINPIFLEFYYFMSLFQSSNNSIGELKRRLKNIYKDDRGNSNSFSRKTKFFDIAKRLNNNMNINNIRFIVFYNHSLNYADMTDSLEEFDLCSRKK